MNTPTKIEHDSSLQNTSDKNESPITESAEMGILDHLRELRKRLLHIIATVAIATCLTYSFVDYIFIWICAPFKQSFPGQSLIGNGPAEAFMIKLQVSVYAGFILGLPLIAQQLWAFIEPALYEKERKTIVPIAAIATSLFITGVLFCYYLVLPLAYSFFFGQYASIDLEPNIRISDQLSTSLTMMTAFGVMFEMPLIVYILASLGMVTHTKLIAVSRYAIVIIFLLSAILTPPDVISQILMATPLIILYGISILVAKKAFPDESTSTQQ